MSSGVLNVLTPRGLAACCDKRGVVRQVGIARHALRQHRHLARARYVFTRRHRSADEWLHAKHIEERRRHAANSGTARVATTREVHTPGRIRRDAGERAVVGHHAPVADVGQNPISGSVGMGSFDVTATKPIRIGIRKRFERGVGPAIPITASAPPSPIANVPTMLSAWSGAGEGGEQ